MIAINSVDLSYPKLGYKDSNNSEFVDLAQYHIFRINEFPHYSEPNKLDWFYMEKFKDNLNLLYKKTIDKSNSINKDIIDNAVSVWQSISLPYKYAISEENMSISNYGTIFIEILYENNEILIEIGRDSIHFDYNLNMPDEFSVKCDADKQDIFRCLRTFESKSIYHGKANS